MSPATWMAVGVIGGTASVARMLGTLWLGRGMPFRGTLIVNLAGTFALGILVGAHVTGDALLLAGAAFLGAFTTFSTWVHEVALLWEAGRRRPACVLLTGALAGGLTAAGAGWGLGGLL